MTRLAVLAVLASLAACNTAEVTEPPPLQADAAACVTDASIIQWSSCDASGVTSGCVAGPNSGIVATSALPPGEHFPVACVVNSFVLNTVGECTQTHCQCAPPGDAGADGGDAASQWVCIH